MVSCGRQEGAAGPGNTRPSLPQPQACSMPVPWGTQPCPSFSGQQRPSDSGLGAGSAPRPTGSQPRGKGPQVAAVASRGQRGAWGGPRGGHTHLTGHHPELHATAVALLGVHPVGGLGGDRRTQDRTAPSRPRPPVGSGAEGPVCEAGAHPRWALLRTGVSADSPRLGGSIHPNWGQRPPEPTRPPAELPRHLEQRIQTEPPEVLLPGPRVLFLRQNGSSPTDVPSTSRDPGTSLLLPQRSRTPGAPGWLS